MRNVQLKWRIKIIIDIVMILYMIRRFKDVIDDLTNIIYPQIQESNYCGVEVKKRLDNTLKSFLTHSQKSFLVQMILILIY